MRARPGRLFIAFILAAAVTMAISGRSVAADTVVRSPVSVAPLGSNWVFRDGYGREVVLRGFNVSASAKLYENSLLPFRSTADAGISAQAMRDQTGANA